MLGKLMIGSAALAGLLMIAGCNEENTFGTSASNDNSPATTAANEPAPEANSDAVSSVQDAVAGGVGSVSAALTTTTEGFAEAAAMGDMYEIEASKIAAMRAMSQDVKDFAQIMVDDHTGTTAELKATLMKSAPQVMLPAELDARREGMIDNLKGASDADFEGRYIAQQINAHNEALTLMQGYAKDGDNAEVKAFATKTAPKIEEHLVAIKAIDEAHKAANQQVQKAR